MNDNVTQAKSPIPRISVVIPLYNHEKYIEAAISSVLSQTVAAAEIIVIDDGSTDSSAAKVRELCKDYPQIIFWSWPNQGAHHTLNAGILRATGDFVAILNSDDCYVPERLAACLAAVQADPSVDVVASVVSSVDDQGQHVSNPWYEEALAFYRREGDLPLALFHANFLVTTSNLFIRRSAFDSVGLFAPLRYTHDLEWSLRLILGKKRIQLIDRPLLAYRQHEKNTISENKVHEEIERAAVFAFFLHRQWCAEGASGELRACLARYVEVLRQQDILEIVEDFLSLLDAKAEPRASALTRPLPTEFQGFLSQLGVSWTGQGSADVLLTRFKAADKVFLRRRKYAADVAAMKVDIQWLKQQRDAWEQTAVEREQSVAALQRQGNDLLEAKAWLQQQRDTWERIATERGQSIAALQSQGQELIEGNTWLQQQRDAWEQACTEREQTIGALQSQMQSLLDSNAWLLEQRDAWETSSKQRDQSIASLEASLRETAERLDTSDADLARVRRHWAMRLINFLSQGKLLGRPKQTIV